MSSSQDAVDEGQEAHEREVARWECAWEQYWKDYNAMRRDHRAQVEAAATEDVRERLRWELSTVEAVWVKANRLGPPPADRPRSKPGLRLVETHHGRTIDIYADRQR